jgi:hypothetical protein
MVEVEGDPPTVDRIYPGDTWALTLNVPVEPGYHPAGQVKRRSLRITVPQEGIGPHEPPPWAQQPEPANPPEPGAGDCPECGTPMQPDAPCCLHCYWEPPAPRR